MDILREREGQYTVGCCGCCDDGAGVTHMSSDVLLLLLALLPQLLVTGASGILYFSVAGCFFVVYLRN